MIEATPEITQTVKAALGYVKAQRDKPFNYAFPPPDGGAWENCEYDQRPVQIADARHFDPEPLLDECGFELLHAPTFVKSFHDDQQVRSLYYEELRSIALHVTGGDRAYVFDHLVRRREEGRPALDFGRKQGSTPGAVGRVHNDYTERSGRRRLALVLGEEGAREVGTRRFCIVNIWRGINGPVIDAPLALCDYRSLQPSDLVEAEMRYPTRVGEIYLATANPAHKWAYFRALMKSEVIVFKQFDSSTDGVSRFTLHAAFEHPETPANAPRRQSIEARVLVVF
jgi:hypothetical protein